MKTIEELRMEFEKTKARFSLCDLFIMMKKIINITRKMLTLMDMQFG